VPTTVDPFYGQQFAKAGTIPVAVTEQVVSVAMMNFTGSPPFKVDGGCSLAQRGRAVNARPCSGLRQFDVFRLGRRSISSSIVRLASGSLTAHRSAMTHAFGMNTGQPIEQLEQFGAAVGMVWIGHCDFSHCSTTRTTSATVHKRTVIFA
jgi:hypothetical protein